MDEGKARAIVTNPLYNGWAVRHRRSTSAVSLAAPWRSAPPVSDELWARVVEVRGMRAKVAGGPRGKNIHLLAKLVWCHCGRAVRADVSRQRNGRIVRRYMHQDCPLWIHESVVSHRLEDPIAAQVAGIRLDASTKARIRALAGKPAPPDTELRRAQLDRELKAKAAAHAARNLTTEAYLAEHDRITAAIDALATPAPSAPVDDADEVVRRLGDLRATWQAADEAARAQLARALYRRITVVNGQVHAVALTDEALRMGLAVAMPTTVVLARPAGLGRTRAHITQRIRIEGRDEWMRASRRTA